jgi:hypothetical protein
MAGKVQEEPAPSKTLIKALSTTRIVSDTRCFNAATNTAHHGHIIKHYCCCYKSCITKEKLLTKVAAIKMAEPAWGTAGFIF